jgi:hypothetical protein
MPARFTSSELLDRARNMRFDPKNALLSYRTIAQRVLAQGGAGGKGDAERFANHMVNNLRKR